ncbi:hypothetical protein GCM10023210_30780 [Chryseobacterium ginsengisoli]|uniref:LTD domain-containing protein n=1 Tax=Chryseobacterium ginsengisoli TaxID=363853 RepID=A0ABP9ML76_9FLAO
MRKTFTLIVFFSFIIFNAQIVINEIYGGGGNSGSSLKNDYIILKNIGSETSSLNGATIQYASASGKFNQYHTLPNIVLNPGQSFLIQEGTSGGGATDLPTPDFIATDILNFDGSSNSSFGLQIATNSGKVALVNNSTQITDLKSSSIMDLVEYGTTENQLTNSESIPSLSSTTALRRTSDNLPNNNFILTTPNPINSTYGNPAIADVDYNYSKFNFIVNSFVKENNEVVFGGEVQDVKVYNEFGKVVLKSPTKTASGLNLIELPKGKYTVTGMINNSPVSQQIVKD